MSAGGPSSPQSIAVQPAPPPPSPVHPTIYLLSPDGVPWSPDPNDFIVDEASGTCLNFVTTPPTEAQDPSTSEFTIPLGPEIVSPWPGIEVINTRPESYRYSEHAPRKLEEYASSSDSDDECSVNSGMSWDLIESDFDSDEVHFHTETSSSRFTTSESSRSPSGIPEVAKLEEHIPPELLPTSLWVIDPLGRTKWVPVGDADAEVVRYTRMYPRPEDFQPSPADSDSSLPSEYEYEYEGTLDLSDAEELGSGSHSTGVFYARLRPPAPLAGISSSGDVFVAAKTSRADDESREMLHHEGRMYALHLPPYLSEHWTGSHWVAEAMYDGDGVLPVVPIVPRFYGYYIPADRKLKQLLSPILLLEACGVPIVRRFLKQKERELLFSFVARLHYAGIAHNSFKHSNILRQPGPLDVHPSLRSDETPSFRLVDFGRAERRERLSTRKWRSACDEEVEDAKDEVYGHRKWLREPGSRRWFKSRKYLRKSIAAGLIDD
ncbi:hypothetical protein CYLTODRAFT_492299 [Cylindrobasidium torrendii FP15055 ss-10]|uniref:Protein kinase domain-containing protein n=1 Tax=Cylindrobasidium torrendii FP15055 ss-10 TaxID=1314674 RepID=A0A0D7B5H2_9AGAR|nr:hypothetical protein CYLTODRAFT_492299 [Cylindrobasidium torrendii FP15055 ss-10]